MTVESLERVIWRLRAKKKDSNIHSNFELRRAIMLEIGTDRRTYYMNRAALKRLGWIKTRGNKRIELTGADITGEEE